MNCHLLLPIDEEDSIARNREVWLMVFYKGESLEYVTFSKKMMPRILNEWSTSLQRSHKGGDPQKAC